MPAKPTDKKQPPIKYAELMKSRKRCHAIEDAILASLERQGLNLTSPAAALRQALQNMWAHHDPHLCDLHAWQRMLQSFFMAINTYGTLERWMELRHMKTKRVYIPQDGTDNDDAYMPALAEVEATKQKELFDDN